MNQSQVVAATSHRDPNRNPIFRQMPSRAPADRLPRPSRSPRFFLVALVVACLACREPEGSYQGYADRTSAIGDSALSAVASYLTLDSTKTVTYDSNASATIERLATRFGG